MVGLLLFPVVGWSTLPVLGVARARVGGVVDRHCLEDAVGAMLDFC